MLHGRVRKGGYSEPLARPWNNGLNYKLERHLWARNPEIKMFVFILL